MRRLVAAVVVMFAASSAFAQQPAASPAAKPAAPVPRGKVELTWYGHSTFVIRTPGGTVIAVDPWFTNPLAKAKNLQPPEKIDFLLVTHGHFDHTADVIPLGKATGAKLVASNELAKSLVAAGFPLEPAKITPLAGNIGGTVKLNDEVSVTYAPAVHSGGYQKDATGPSESAGNPVGYFIHIKDGPRIYHTGDTAPFSDIQHWAKRWPIDVMLVSIGGHFVMEGASAAQHIAWANPKIAIPMHFGTYPVLSGRPAEVNAALKQLKSKVKLVELQVGETRIF